MFEDGTATSMFEDAIEDEKEGAAFRPMLAPKFLGADAENRGCVGTFAAAFMPLPHISHFLLTQVAVAPAIAYRCRDPPRRPSRME